MRVLMTTDTVGGVWTFTSELTRQLLERGHSVDLVSFGRKPSPEQQAWINRLLGRDSNDRVASTDRTPRPSFTCTATEIPLEWMQNNQRAYEDGQHIVLDQIATQYPDLVLSNQFCFGRLNTPIPRIVVAHSDVLSWAKACRPSALEPTPWLNRYSSLVLAGLLDAAAVVTPTAWMGKALGNNFFLPNNYSVIPNGVTVQPLAEPAPQRELQAITAGRLWDEAKGLDTLRGLQSPIPVLVAGDNGFETAQSDAAWPKHLTNLGPLSQPALHRQFCQSAMYLCTSRYEPFGLAPLEAALCGCAVIARDIPSLREVWGEAALYFTDGTSLTSQIEGLSSSADDFSEAQFLARRRAQQYTPERMTDAYLTLFESVLSQQKAMPHVA